MTLHPLTVGSRWTYRVTWRGFEAPESVVTQTVAPETRLVGGRVYRIVRPDDADLPPLYLRSDDTGIYRYDDGLADELPLVPADPEATWVEQRDEQTIEFYTLPRLETITVAAGTFLDCTRIEAAGTWAEGQPATILKMWYAPEIGLVGRIWSPAEGLIIAHELLAFEIAE